jgi:hypothetical protein
LLVVLDEDLNTRALEPGALLWHYTNFPGLKGILEGTFWASSLPYLNDTEEFRYGLNVALEVLQTQLTVRLRELSPAGGAIYDEVASFFLDRYRPRDVFVASLSTEKDDLSQWRGYGGVGPSFSIGFDPRGLERRADETLFALDEVQYGKSRNQSRSGVHVSAHIPAVGGADCGAYKLAGFPSVTITPRSGDHGRDVIATSRDGYTVRVLDQAKKYAPDRTVGYEAIRAFIMVLDADRATRGYLTTTGVFPPNVLRDPLIAPRLGSTLELVDGANLTRRLAELAESCPGTRIPGGNLRGGQGSHGLVPRPSS